MQIYPFIPISSKALKRKER